MKWLLKRRFSFSPKAPRQDAAPPPPPRENNYKVMHCLKCGTEQSMPKHALSTFCKKCGKRINLQNYTISGKFHGALETLGELHVTPTGELRSNIVCGSAVVEGKVNGSIRASAKVELRQTAEMMGPIEAEALVVEDGAAFRGDGKIGA